MEILIFAICLAILFHDNAYILDAKQLFSKHVDMEFEIFNHKEIVWQYYKARKDWKTSNLGDILFKNKDLELFAHLKKPKTFKIYIFNEYSILYTGADLREGLDNSSFLDACSVKNCIFTRNKKYIEHADVVLVNLYNGQVPTFGKHFNQRWVVMTLESPVNMFNGALYPDRVKLEEFAGLFEWIMSYRADADVPIPYGRTVPRNTPLLLDLSNPEQALADIVPYWKLKQTRYPIAILISNCSFKDRIRFIKKLMNFIPIDVYGDCAIDRMLKKSCAGDIVDDCSVLPHYLFYLAMENSSCYHYLTEKIFFNAYAKGAIPIIWGALYEDCLKLLPPQSFIHVQHFQNYEHLASYIAYLMTDKKELLKYHVWRKHFKVAQEHGFSGTTGMQLCRLCEALNYNNFEPITYQYYDLMEALDRNRTCVSFMPKIRTKRALK